MSEMGKSVVHNTDGDAMALVDRIAGGELPTEFTEIEELAKQLVKVNARTAQTLAVIVADVRSNHLRSTTEWTMWAATTLDLQGAYLHHIHRIGKLLTGLVKLGTKCSIQHYRRFFALPIDKLYPLSRLAVDQVGPWLTHYKPEEMNRENIRDAVAAFLGEAVEPRSEQPALPGFEDILDDVIALDTDAIKAAVKNGETAQHSLFAGVKLLDAALEYHQHADDFDPLYLHSIKKALVVGIDAIEKIIARKS